MMTKRILPLLVSTWCAAASGCSRSCPPKADTRADERIAAACALAASHVVGTLQALKDEPSLGFVLAARDAGAAQLCGGDAGKLSDAAQRQDLATTRSELVRLQRVWCPACAR